MFPAVRRVQIMTNAVPIPRMLITDAGALFAIVVCCSITALRAQPRIESASVQSNGWVHLQGRGETNRILTLQGSSNMRDWNDLAVLCNQPNFGDETNAFQYFDPATPQLPQRFYRVAAATPQITNDWRNQVTSVSDPFTCAPDQASAYPVTWVKFLIMPTEPLRVYYQDSTKYLFHYDFARERLAPFRDLSREAFDAISLRTNKQQAVLGAVLWPWVDPAGNLWAPEYAIQFVGLDPYPPEQVRRWFELVRSTVITPPGVKALYFPSFEQQGVALANNEYFSTNGVTVSSVDRWSSGNQAYAAGWALGRLRFVPAAEIASAYLQALLLPGDILLTDGIPAGMPLVAGILTMAPATPNSHVALLAGSYAIPFGFVASTNDVARALSLTNKEVLLQVSTVNGYGRIQLIDMSEGLDESTRRQILAMKTPLPVNLQPKQRYGAYSASADTLVPGDTRFFGGKAANFGFLRRAIPSNSPPAIAFSLDLWDDFMAQTLPGGKTLGLMIADRLSRYTNYPPDLVALSSDLVIVRDLITKTASFTAAQQQALTTALQLFEPNRNIRFRSSSNAEDNQVFAAAGLYDSYSGCLADDLDGDTTGPCRCDPAELNERGVFRAIQKVYASFYNDNAFLERLRYRIDETQVGMGLLVHHSVPDVQEMANGVATLNVHRWWNGGGFVYQISGDLVTQAGAVSVTNPRSDAQPERVSVTDYGSGVNLTVEGRSSLVPLGAYVLTWEDEYRELMALLTAVIHAYSAQYPDKTDFLLDFEYKKNIPGELQVKQVRELPPARNDKVRPFLLGGSFAYRLLQGEGWGTVFARQRLKCRLALRAPTIQLTDSALQQGFYSDAQFEFLNDTRIEKLMGGFTNWPNPVHVLTNQGSYAQVTESWTFGGGTTQRTFMLSSMIPLEKPIATPFIMESELLKNVSVTYSKPIFDPLEPTVPISTESIALTSFSPASGPIIATNYGTLEGTAPPPVPAPKSIEVASYQYLNGGVLEEVPEPPIIIKTYPLPFFDEIRITGLISEPILLGSYYAQSAVPAHHNWGAWYVFEPRLDPVVPQNQLDELTAANIRLLYVTIPPPWETNTVYQVLGFDGKFRSW